jgi:SSS family solute:Na+ symporter
MDAAVAAIKPANPTQTATVYSAVSKDIGLKLDLTKITAIIGENSVKPLSDDQIKSRLQDSVAENDYDSVILSLVKRYCPSGLLGLALTALLASFMSGMAGNVTAFNTVWTYDLYQAYLAPNKSDQHYFRMGQAITFVGIILSIGCAYFASHYSNAMDVVQLVFGFVNAPLFATFLLGMFWARTTGTGAFLGLLGGTAMSAVFHALTIAAGNTPGIKGGYVHVMQTFPSEMAQNFWLASFAFTACFILTLGISLATKRTKTDQELKGLVYSLTPKIQDHQQPLLLRPGVLGTILIICCVILNIIFW